MRKYVLLVLLAIPSAQVSACTIFTASVGKSVLVGNNEDYSPGSKSFLWVRPPAYIGNGYIFWGFKQKYPEGGMNDKGLFIDAAALPDKITIKKDLRKPDFKGYLIEKILKECASVTEVLELVSRYNLTWQEKAQIMVVDKSGDYAVIHANYIIRKKTPVFVLTNFSLNDADGNKFTCWRRNTAITDLTTKVISVDLFRDILSKTAQKEPDNATVYSQVCDLTTGSIHLYSNHNFERVKIISLIEILKQGRQNIPVSKLFPISIGAVVERRINKSGLTEGFRIYRQVKKSSKQSNYNFSQSQLDNVAYKMLNQKRYKESIAVFQFNNEIFPNSANSLAGLANALLISGDSVQADKFYQKVRQTDSTNFYSNTFASQPHHLKSFRINGFSGAKSVEIHLKNLQYETAINAKLKAMVPGIWTTEIVIPPGKYSYSYKIDDSWIMDPNNRLTTKSGEYFNSFMISR